ncbi:arylsulfatase [soil metagenome]
MKTSALLLASLLAALSPLDAASKPNVIFILCDDLGYGDVKCFNPEGKIATPQMDQMAARGMKFTDAHTPSSVCSPTRYGVITGRYSWRSRLQSGVLGGLSPRLIEENRMTVASMLKENGYKTACIGKWHIGMDWEKLPGKTVNELGIENKDQVHNVDYAKPITNGPNSVGFDYYYGISASLDMVPYTFIENTKVTVVPSMEREFPMTQGRNDGKCRLGPAAPEFEVEDVLPKLTDRTVSYIKEQATAAKEGNPFFIYMPLNAPHTPIAPSKEWQGKSGISPYADFVMETDAMIGKVLATVKEQGLEENTLIIVTSDNGCSPHADFKELLSKGHNPSYVYRGYKADIYDGGHRVPFIVQWPATVKAGSSSDQLICLTDFMATAADAAGVKIPESAAEDSFSFLSLLQGKQEPTRPNVIHHSINGSFAIREGSWKLELCPGSGGWSDPRPGKEAKDAPLVQLFDLSKDIGEKNNIQAEHPEIVAKLTKLLEKQVTEGRSTTGAPQKNTVEPVIWKSKK